MFQFYLYGGESNKFCVQIIVFFRDQQIVDIYICQCFDKMFWVDVVMVVFGKIGFLVFVGYQFVDIGDKQFLFII